MATTPAITAPAAASASTAFRLDPPVLTTSSTTATRAPGLSAPSIPLPVP